MTARSLLTSHWMLRAREMHVAWPVAIVFASGGLSFEWACVVSFAAMALLASRTLATRPALLTLLGAVLANQFVGFTFLHYPHTLECAMWGPILALGTLAAYAAARMLAQPVLAALGAFGAYEATLAAFSWLTTHSVTDYSPAILRLVAAGNAGGLLLLGVVYAALCKLEQVGTRRAYVAHLRQALREFST